MSCSQLAAILQYYISKEASFGQSSPTVGFVIRMNADSLKQTKEDGGQGIRICACRPL